MSITMSRSVLDGIDVQHVTAYLGGTGWTRRADFPRPELLVFDGPRDDNDEQIEAVIPSLKSFSDFRRKIADLLNALVLDGRPDALREAYRAGFNANMCEALLSLKRPGLELKMEFEVQWSRRLPPAAGIPKCVRVEGSGFDFLEATAKALQAPSESGERVFTGEIVKLHRELGEERVAVLRFIEEGRRFQAQITLGPEDYGIACDAHRDGKQVTLQGRLERISSKKWRIFGVQSFGTVDQSTDIEKNRITSGIMKS